MRHNKRQRAAVNALIDLALREPAGPVPLPAVAYRQRVPLSRLEYLFAQLRLAGLVCSTRGPGGGYTLARAPAAISLSDIVDAVETNAAGARAHPRSCPAVDDLSLQLDAVMHAHMAGITLGGLVSGLREAGVTVEQRTRHRSVTPRPVARPHLAHVPNSVFDLGAWMASADGRASPR